MISQFIIAIFTGDEIEFSKCHNVVYIVSNCATNWAEHTISENGFFTCPEPAWAAIAALASRPPGMFRANKCRKEIGSALGPFVHGRLMENWIGEPAWIKFRMIAAKLLTAFRGTVQFVFFSTRKYQVFFSAIAACNDNLLGWLLAYGITAAATRRTKTYRAAVVIGAGNSKLLLAKFASELNILTGPAVRHIAESSKLNAAIRARYHPSHYFTYKQASRWFEPSLLSRQCSNQRDARISGIIAHDYTA